MLGFDDSRLQHLSTHVVNKFRLCRYQRLALQLKYKHGWRTSMSTFCCFKTYGFQRRFYNAGFYVVERLYYSKGPTAWLGGLVVNIRVMLYSGTGIQISMRFTLEVLHIVDDNDFFVFN